MKSIINLPSTIPSSSNLLLLFFFYLFFLSFSTIPSSHAALLDQCSVAVSVLFTNPIVSSCIPLEPLASLLTTNFTITLVNQTTAAFCAYPTCSKPAVDLIENTLVQNCAEDPEDRAGFRAMFGATALYVPFKQGLCSQVDMPRNGTFCLTLLADSLKDYMDQHPSPDGVLVFANTTVLSDYLEGLPPVVLCTPCNKAMINPISRYVAINQLTLEPSVVVWTRAIQKTVQSKCGEDFIDGRPMVEPTPTPSSSSSSSLSVTTASIMRCSVIGVLAVLVGAIVMSQ